MRSQLKAFAKAIIQEMESNDSEYGQNLLFHLSTGSQIDTAYGIAYRLTRKKFEEWLRALEGIQTQAFAHPVPDASGKLLNPLGNEILSLLPTITASLRAKAGIAAHYEHLVMQSGSSRDVRSADYVHAFEEHFSRAQMRFIIDDLKRLAALCG